MRALLEQLRVDAEQRLTLPPGRHPSQEVERYRRFLEWEKKRLKLRHRAGLGGRDFCQARALVLDLLFCALLRALEPAAPAPQAGAKRRYALVATGGYGRGELNPFSDVDIMFLHTGLGGAGAQPPAFLELLEKGLLWDIAPRVSNLVRSVEESVKAANTDMRSKTALLEARLICGDAALFADLQAAVLERCVKGHEAAYIKARVEDQATRQAKFGDSACMQEPNVKNGCGGLRDYQNLLWMAFVKYRSRTLAELQARDFISDQDRLQLERAYDFLLRTRNEMHYHADHAVDVLTRAMQPAVARHLGYSARSPRVRLEHFMRDYYRHSRNIYVITRTLERRLSLLPAPARLPLLQRFLRPRRPAASLDLDGFRLSDGEIRAVSADVFQAAPRRLMRLFRYAQQRGLALHPDLAQSVRRHLHLVDRPFCQDPQVHETFLEILNQRGSVAATLRTMHEVGLLGRYLPAFGKLTCLVQHEFYHQYAADEHTLMCLQKLDELVGVQTVPLGQHAELLQKLERPYVLYLALLLHDAGKVEPSGNHAERGARIALRVAARLGLDTATTESLRLLIRHHLDMTLISQRRDLDDPKVIRGFAGLVQNQENLNLLTLHTYADSTGTSDKLWNGFKDTLLWALHHKTRQVLGGQEYARAEAHQRELLAAEVRGLAPATFRDDELRGHFDHLPPRYFLFRTAKEILADLSLAHRFMQRQLDETQNPLEPVVDWHHEPNRGYSLVKVCTWDRHGLFSKIAGALTAAGLNILGAEIFTRNDNLVLDTFFVTDALTGLLVNREERERFEALLQGALAGDLDLAALIARRKPLKPLYVPHEGERMPTVIRFDDESSETRTVLEVEAEDRVGLLYAVSQALSEMAVDVSLAKICTERGAAMDSFYVSEFNGAKIRDRARQHQIETRLRAALGRLG